MVNSTQEHPRHPRNPRTELRILKIANPGKDYLADALDGKMVLVVGWYPAWTTAGINVSPGDEHGTDLWRSHWKARLLELPDRFIPESELLKVL